MNPVILDVRPRDEDFYRERHRLVFRAIKRLYERSEPVDALTVSELLAQQGELEEAGGRDGVSQLASTVPVPGNARHYARIVQQNSLLRRLLDRLADDPEVGPRARGRAAGARRARRAAALQRRPRGAGRGLPRAQGHPLARGRPARGARQRQRRGHRHAIGVRRPRRDHRRLSARQPDHPRRPPGDGQVRLGRQHRRARRGQGAPAGRLLLARDVGRRARPAADRQAGADPERQAAQGPGRRARLGEGAQGLQRDRGQRRCGSTSPRTSGCSTCGRRRGACTPRSTAPATAAWR